MRELLKHQSAGRSSDSGRSTGATRSYLGRRLPRGFKGHARPSEARHSARSGVVRFVASSDRERAHGTQHRAARIVPRERAWAVGAERSGYRMYHRSRRNGGGRSRANHSGLRYYRRRDSGYRQSNRIRSARLHSRTARSSGGSGGGGSSGSSSTVGPRATDGRKRGSAATETDSNLRHRRWWAPNHPRCHMVPVQVSAWGATETR